MTVKEFEALRARQSPSYWIVVRIKAAKLQSDGCSKPALQAYLAACLEHDVHYRTGKTVYGDPITRIQADALFATRIRQMAWDGLGWRPSTWRHFLGFPMSAWRWVAVRAFGASSYKGTRRNRPSVRPAPRQEAP